MSISIEEYHANILPEVMQEAEKAAELYQPQGITRDHVYSALYAICNRPELDQFSDLGERIRQAMRIVAEQLQAKFDAAQQDATQDETGDVPAENILMPDLMYLAEFANAEKTERINEKVNRIRIKKGLIRPKVEDAIDSLKNNKAKILKKLESTEVPEDPIDRIDAATQFIGSYLSKYPKDVVEPILIYDLKQHFKLNTSDFKAVKALL